MKQYSLLNSVCSRMLPLVALVLLLVPAARAIVIDRIAAIVDRDVIALSSVNQVVNLRLYERNAGESEDDYRRRVLDAMIAQSLRFRDVQRFGAEDVSKDAIESRLRQVVERFPSPAAFDATLRENELTLDEVRALIKRQLQVDAYIEERFSPLIFVSMEEVEQYYSATWVPQRRARGLAVPPLTDVATEIRTLLKSERLHEEVDKWTSQLRARANVDIYAWR